MMTFNSLEEVKAYAKQLLEETDYSALDDINLENKKEFIQYRNTVRYYFFNPSLNVQFPQEPVAIWGEPVSTITTVVQPQTNIPTA